MFLQSVTQHQRGPPLQASGPPGGRVLRVKARAITLKIVMFVSLVSERPVSGDRRCDRTAGPTAAPGRSFPFAPVFS